MSEAHAVVQWIRFLSVFRERCDVLCGGDDPQTEEQNAEERRSRGRIAAGRRRQESQEEEEVEHLCDWDLSRLFSL